MWNCLQLASSNPPKWASVVSDGKCFPVSSLAAIDTAPPPIMFRETQTSNEGLLQPPSLGSVTWIREGDLLREPEEPERSGRLKETTTAVLNNKPSLAQTVYFKLSLGCLRFFIWLDKGLCVLYPHWGMTHIMPGSALSKPDAIFEKVNGPALNSLQ